MSEIDNYLEEHFPGEQLLTKWKRSYYRLISVDGKSLCTISQLKSSTVIKSETLRHLVLHRNMIHCFSRFRHFWEMLMMMTYFLAFFYIPFDSAFLYGEGRLEPTPFISFVISFIDIVCLMDIVINFRTGFQDSETKEVVLEAGKIACHYVRSFFFIDLFSAFPDRIIAALLNEDKTDLIKYDLFHCVNDRRMSCFWDVVVILSLLKFLQIPLFFKYLIKYLRQHNFSSYFIKMFRLLLTVIFCYHFLVCINFLIIRIFVASSSQNVENQLSSLTDKSFWEKTDNFEKYIICFFYVTYTLTLFASAIEEKIQIDMLVGIVFTLFGFVLHIWLVSQAYMYLRTAYGPSVQFQENRYQMRTFMSFKRISKSIQKRVLEFYDFSFKGKFFRQKQVDELLGSELRNLVTIETCEKLLRGNYIFKRLPEDLLHAVAYCLEEVVFLRNDVICKIDSSRSQKLFLIVSGTVAVYDEDGVEIAHLYDKSIFGETAFLHYDEKFPTLNYVATEETVLLVLNRTDFMMVLAESPEILSEMRKESINVKIETADNPIEAEEL